MKKSLKIVLGVICVAVLAALVFQIKTVPLENGEKVIVYMPPFDRAGGSVGADLREQLEAEYGQEGVPTEFPGQWQGETVTVHDTASYTFEYLGRKLWFFGGDYLRCTVVTERKVVLDSGEEAAAARRTSVYVGYDDADLSSSERARVLWGTLQESYSDGEDAFHDILSQAGI